MTDLHRTPYLEQRAEKYYFRRRLPFDSNSKSNRFFVFSLRTDIASEARDISGRLTAMTTLAYDYARGCPTMDQNTFKALLSELVRVEIAAFEKTRLSTGQRSLAAAEFAAQREDAIQTTWSAARTEGGDRRAGLAATRAAFYTGPIAQRIVDFHADKGGLLRAEDLASYEVREEPTLAIDFRGAQVHCCGAWCQGISMAQTLAMLEQAGPDAARDGNQINLHFLIEVLKRVFADREAHVTDPRFMQIAPEALLDPAFIADRLRSIDETSDPLPAPAAPATVPSGERPVFEAGCADTSHVSVIDSAGNIFSATPSDPSYDTVVIPGTGLSVSSRGSQSGAIPGHLNALAPGKRPRLTPNPILGLKDGQPWLAMGTPGGDVQVQAMAQVLIGMLDLGRTPREAVEAPRVATYAFPGSFAPHDVHPNKVLFEADMPEHLIESLRARGHDLEQWPARTWMAGGVCIALRDISRADAVADPRRAGTAKTGAKP